MEFSLLSHSTIETMIKKHGILKLEGILKVNRFNIFIFPICRVILAFQGPSTGHGVKSLTKHFMKDANTFYALSLN